MPLSLHMLIRLTLHQLARNDWTQVALILNENSLKRLLEELGDMDVPGADPITSLQEVSGLSIYVHDIKQDFLIAVEPR